MVTAPGSGAEIIPFLKTWVNLPMAIGFTVLYAKVRCCFQLCTSGMRLAHATSSCFGFEDVSDSCKCVEYCEAFHALSKVCHKVSLVRASSLSGGGCAAAGKCLVD